MVPSVVINDFDLVCAIHLQHKTNPPFLVNADAVLSPPIPLELFKVISWRDIQRFKKSCRMQLQELASGDSLYVAKSRDCSTMEQRLCLTTQK